MEWIYSSYIIAIFGIFMLTFVDSLKFKKVTIPPEESDEAYLDCQYDLENEVLYDVKWYKDDNQFYRCQADGNYQVFSVEGVTVIPERPYTGKCSITLTSLTNKSAGKYRCEVSLDSPTFATIASTGKLRISQASRRMQPQIQVTEEPLNLPEQQYSGVTTIYNHKISTIFICNILLFFIKNIL